MRSPPARSNTTRSRSADSGPPRELAFVSCFADQKGAVAETAVALAAIQRGIGVLRPLSDGLRYDLIFDTGRRLLRVQCKWAVRRGDVIAINCRSCRRGPDGFVRKAYSAGEIDLVVAYLAETGRCYALAPSDFDGHFAVQLRLAPTRNNQALGIRWACDHDFERLDWTTLGAVAQLGERLAGSQ